MMGVKVQTPTCSETGLPLLIYSPELEPQPSSFAFRTNTNFHHTLHPRTAPELQGSLAGKAYRYSTGQTMSKSVHDRYHALFDGPSLHDDPAMILRHIVLSRVGVAPRRAIDVLSDQEPQLTEMSDADFERLTHPKSYHYESAHKARRYNHPRNTIAKFIVSFAVEHSAADAVSESTIDEFLHVAHDPTRTKELGNFILVNAIRSAIEDLVPNIDTYRRQGMVSPHHDSDPMSAVRKLINKRRLPDYHSSIRHQIVHGQAA